MPKSRASATARLLGAETAHRIGAPGRDRLLHEFVTRAAADHHDAAREGHRAFDERVPDELIEGVVAADVFAHRACSVPFASKRAAAWRPPVVSNTRCRSRNASGKPVTIDGLTVSAEATFTMPRSRNPASVARPHTPHALVVVKCRSSAP